MTRGTKKRKKQLAKIKKDFYNSIYASDLKKEQEFYYSIYEVANIEYELTMLDIDVMPKSINGNGTGIYPYLYKLRKIKNED